jgi:small subunit ribosomal protein S15
MLEVFIMARMYAKRKGKSGSTKPHNETAPVWSNKDSAAVTALIVELGKSGHSSASIGTILRDQHAVPDVRSVLNGKRINAVLSENDIGGTYPEDMMNLMRKAVGVIEHLGSGNRKDLHNKRSLELTEAKIRRLAKYYVSEGRLPSGWKYKRDQLRLMVE